MEHYFESEKYLILFNNIRKIIKKRGISKEGITVYFDREKHNTTIDDSGEANRFLCEFKEYLKDRKNN